MLKRFLILPSPDKSLMIEAFFSLLFSRLAILFFSFRRIASRLESPVTLKELSAENEDVVQRIGCAVNRVAVIHRGRVLVWYELSPGR